MYLGGTKITGTNVQTTASSISATFTNVPSGIYTVAIHFGEAYAYISNASLKQVIVEIPTFTSTSV